METDKVNKLDYPRFIPNKPSGIDKYEGKSQENLAKAIVRHIIDIDSNSSKNEKLKSSRIIGLEGGWGAGKSNIIKQLPKFFHKTLKESEDLENKESKYYIFEYDAWGHQEDLQRRSFLEKLTGELISDKILQGKIYDDNDKKQIEWSEHLKNLLAKRVIRINKSIPKFNIGALITFLCFASTPVTSFIADKIFSKNSSSITGCEIFGLTVLAFSPIVLGFLLWIIISKIKKEPINIGYFLKISKDEDIETRNLETINEDEPTVAKFTKWMNDVSDHLNGKKLIIVYDNMDRLPAEKVKELWSSIHTFFSEGGFANIWTIIPFDEKHLSCAFGEKDEEKIEEGKNNGNSKIDERTQLTKYFISKTFPIVYRVTPPVITDYKAIFNDFFKEAFGETEARWKDDINRIFRLEKPDATVRDIIEFINQLVTLKNVWGNDIDILYMAIFLLRKDKLFENSNVVNQILSGIYLGEYISKLVSNSEELQKNISALIYGVPLDMAEQIPMSKYIDNCFALKDKSDDINRYAESHNFTPILSDKVKNADLVQTDNIVGSLSALETNIFDEGDKKIITSLWDELAKRKYQLKLEKQEFDSTSKEIILHTSDSAREGFLKELCGKIRNFDKTNFSGKDYYNSLNEIKEFLKNNNKDFDILSTLQEYDVDAKIFIDYVIASKENYKLFKLKTNPQKLDEYLTSHSPDLGNGTWEQFSEVEGIKDLTDYEHIIIISTLSTLIKDEHYKFDKFLNQIKEEIPKANDINFKQYFDVYKLLSPDEKPLEIQLTSAQCQAIWNVLSSTQDTDNYLEIVAIQIANGVNTYNTLNEEQIKYISENIDYYANYGGLLIKAISLNNSTLNSVLKYMTEKKLGHNLSLETVLPKFIEIKDKLGIDASILLDQLNDFQSFKNNITEENIQEILPQPQFFQFSKETKNPLTDYLNKTIIEKLSTIPTNQLFQFKQQDSNNYWIVVMSSLIDTEFISPLSDNLTDLGKKYLDEIAASRITPIPTANDLIYKLIEKLDVKKVQEAIITIKNHFCNNEAIYKMDVDKFIFLYKWFENGDFSSRAGDVCQYILSPVATSDACLKIMQQNTDLYTNIINEAKERAETFKKSISTKIKDSTDATLIAFAKKIGVEEENKKEKK